MMKKSRLSALLVLISVVAPVFVAEAQFRDPQFYDYPQNHIDWYTIESEHFLVHFQEGNSRPAQVTSRIAEEIYPDVTALYDHEPDTKISIVLNDRLDYANGAAFFLDNKIEIWLPALDSPLRGTHDWLRNVITHEFVHIIQLQASLKGSRRSAITYLQWLSYEDVRRPDVLYGYPSGIISYPLSKVGLPAWLAEGTAQYQRSTIFYDYWDSHRDMILRTRVLDDSYLSLEVMGTFASKTSIEREVTYNQGFAFTNYLASTYGEQVLNDISRAFSRRGVYDVNRAIRIATDKSGHEVFNEWIASLKAHYEPQIASRTFTNAEFIEPDGFYNFFPTLSPDGTELAYLSNRGREDARVLLYIRNLKTGELEEVTDTPIQASLLGGFTLSCGLDLEPEIRFIQNSFTFLPDGDQILYNRIRETRYGEPYNDIYLHSRESKKSTRLSSGARLTEPAVSPDGSTISALIREDGILNIVLIDLKSAKNDEVTSIASNGVQRVTSYSSGEQVYRPVWHPDGSKLYFAWSGRGHRSIRSVDLETGDVTTLLADERIDYRDPHISKDGNSLYFSSDKDGIFNIYVMDLATNSVRQLTSVVGGAFMPNSDADGNLYYAEYLAEGYKIAKLPVDDFAVKNDVASTNQNQSLNIAVNIGVASSNQPSSSTENEVANSEAIQPSNTARSGQANSNYSTHPEQSSTQLANPTAEPVFTMAGNDMYERPYSPHSAIIELQATSWLNSFNDNDITPLPHSLFGIRRLGDVPINIPTRYSSDDRTFKPYEDTFTSFGIYPAIRFDNYSKIRGSNADLLTSGQFSDLAANLWRDTKVGMYFSSREMLDRLSLFGGLLIGPGSTDANEIGDYVQPAGIMAMDRDVFLIAEYRGLPFIQRSWSPTVSIELFNIRRNVANGLQIEEFPCTACLPDTTSIGISYDIWQAQISLISKLNRFTVVDLGWYHSPYRVSTNSFFSREFRQSIGGSSSRYFIGNTFTAGLSFKLHTPHRHSDIAQRGITASIRHSYQPSSLLDGYDIRGGELIPQYNDYKIHTSEIDIRHGFQAIGNRLFDVRSRFHTNYNATNEYFFLDYIGGLPGMRSYSFFALGGNTTFFTQLNFHQPLFERIHRQAGRFTIDKLFARFFAETGNGWGGPLDVGNNLKSGVGAELRLSMNSYYLFPSRLFISMAYGLNEFDVNLPESFITTTGQNSVTFGNEFLFNFGLLFDFDF